MDPRVLGAAFRVAILILGTALLMLPFQTQGTAEQVVAVLAAAVGALFAGTVVLLARAATGRPPLSSDDISRPEALNGRLRVDPPRNAEEERDT
jgi:threonine/homoserine efflux transporter RhtA